LATEAARSADVVLFVIDASRPLGGDAAGTIDKLDPGRAILVLNKIDLPPADDLHTFSVLYPHFRLARTSALTGEGVAGLKKAMVETAAGEGLSRIARERVVLNSRLVSLLRAAAAKVETLKKSLANHNPLEILALETREILTLYEEATGRRYQEDLLDAIFSRFCIGK
jgi:tRNA modification GTPase